MIDLIRADTMTLKQFVPKSILEDRLGHSDGDNPLASANDRKGQKRAISIPQHSLGPQQRYVKRPKHPGVVTFDRNFHELPLHGSKAKRQERVLSSDPESNIQETNASSYSHGLSMSPELKTPQRQPTPDSEQDACPAEEKKCRCQYLHLAETAFTANDRAATLSQNRSEIQKADAESLKSKQMPVNILARELSLSQPAEATLQPDSFDRGCTSLAKLVYAELTTLGANDKDLASLSDPCCRCDAITWRVLTSLRLALLYDSYDFFQIIRDPDASWPIKRLALKYGEPGMHTNAETRNFLLQLRVYPQSEKLQMLDFAEKARTFLDTMALNLSGFNAQWETINENIHCYLHAAMHVAVDVPCVYQCKNVLTSTRWASWRNFEASSSHPLDDELRRQFCFTCPQPPEYLPATIDDMFARARLPLKEHVVWFVFGWLCFGPRIASNFHEYCKVTTFLVWFGATF